MQSDCEILSMSQPWQVRFLVSYSQVTIDYWQFLITHDQKELESKFELTSSLCLYLQL